MDQPVEMTTLSQVIEKLRQKGFDNEINMNEHKEMVSHNLNKKYTPQDLLIFKTFRFEGDSDPSDNAALYVVEDKEGEIGYIIDTYGAYSSHDGTEFDDFIKKIPTEDREDEKLFI